MTTKGDAEDDHEYNIHITYGFVLSFAGYHVYNIPFS